MHLQWFLVKSETHVTSSLRWSYTIKLNAALSTQSPYCAPFSNTQHRKPRSNLSHRSPSNPGVQLCIKKKGFYSRCSLLPAGTRCSRPRAREEHSSASRGPAHFVLSGHLRRGHGERGCQQQRAWHVRDAGPIHSFCCLCL